MLLHNGGVHLRHARPTLRVIDRDLRSGWDSPAPRRLLVEGTYTALHPMGELQHPIIRQATESIAANPSGDIVEGIIKGVKQLRLLEIKTSQWRGALWEDPKTGVHWLISAGLAKGEHEDHADFYKQLQRKRNLNSLLPTEDDQKLLKRETAARLFLNWELNLQAEVTERLGEICTTGGERQTEIRSPLPTEPSIARLGIEVEPHPDGKADDIYVTIEPPPYSEEAWQAALRVLITVNPPVQDWDNDGKGNFFMLAETGVLERRVQALQGLAEHRELASPEPGKHAHWAHREHLVEKSVDGRAVRALCGTFFVPLQDHEKLGECPQCAVRYQAIT